MKKMISNEEVGIKTHQEMVMESPESCNCTYLGGQDPGEYSLQQQNELARNVRKHRAK